MLLQDFTGPTFLFWLYTARVCLLCIIGAYRYSSWMGVLRKPNFFPCWVRPFRPHTGEAGVHKIPTCPMTAGHVAKSAKIGNLAGCLICFEVGAPKVSLNILDCDSTMTSQCQSGDPTLTLLWPLLGCCPDAHHCIGKCLSVFHISLAIMYWLYLYRLR